MLVRIGKSTATAQKAVRFLRENGYIERVGSDRAGWWHVLLAVGRLISADFVMRVGAVLAKNVGRTIRNMRTQSGKQIVRNPDA